MKALKMFPTTVVVLTMILFFTSNSFAQEAWYVCEVKEVGVADFGWKSCVNITLTDTDSFPAFQEKRFKAKGNFQEQMLTVALTAITSGFKVRVFTDLSVLSAPIIKRINLIAPENSAEVSLRLKTISESSLN